MDERKISEKLTVTNALLAFIIFILIVCMVKVWGF